MMIVDATNHGSEKQKMNILIADDSDVIRERLKDLIEEMENVNLVGEARDALEALEILNDLETDIVILDIRMPGGNGMAVLKSWQPEKIRQLSWYTLPLHFPSTGRLTLKRVQTISLIRQKIPRKCCP